MSARGRPLAIFVLSDDERATFGNAGGTPREAPVAGDYVFNRRHETVGIWRHADADDLRRKHWIAERTIEKLRDRLLEEMNRALAEGMEDEIPYNADPEDADRDVDKARAEAAAEWAALPKEG